MKKILIIQTAFIGDVILATALIEKIHDHDSLLLVDVLVRKGNEGLILNHPWVNNTIIWDKNNGKYKALLKVIRTIRSANYDVVVNVQRFASTGLMTGLSKAKIKIGFNKNPLSLLYTHKIEHKMDGIHEVDRNLKLLQPLGINGSSRPKLYPSTLAREKIRQYQKSPYVCVAPSSVWYTKQWHIDKWIELLGKISNKNIYLLGAPSDVKYCDEILSKVGSNNIRSLAGKLTLLESAVLMENAEMNYVNDSAPMHLASSVNAPVTAIFCSTIPRFGFGPLSDNSRIVEVEEDLDCRPCGLHGLATCPKGHFKCAKNIDVDKVLQD